ncbi:hypothetical protein HHK36_002303 [Tetracentron sinense]|uniref:CCHC-type domain-containing protein n=1 Tax=Tetracentron sinense TaxID=13715 RepID=A0A835DSE8_TETSI|nr:hypothetical protein HHK36_002303 [Tetracentron sinense]
MIPPSLQLNTRLSLFIPQNQRIFLNGNKIWRQSMRVCAKPVIGDGILRINGKDALTGVPENVVVTPSTNTSAFVGATSTERSCRHVFKLGVIRDVRLLCLFRFKIWWMIPRMGNSGSDIPIETQMLLLEAREEPVVDASKGSTSYILFLPVLDGEFRSSLQGNSANELEFCLESGDPAIVTAQSLKAVFVNYGNNPFDLMNESMKTTLLPIFLTSTVLDFSPYAGYWSGTAELLHSVKPKRQIPGMLDWFGWCTWDAFYTEVNPQGIKDGLKSLLRFNMDLGWEDDLIAKIQDHTLIEIEDCLLEEGKHRYQNSIVGKFLVDKPFNLMSAKKTMLQAWRSKSNITTLDLSKDMVLFMFDEVSDLNKVLANSPWAFNGHLLALQKWKEDTSVSEFVFDSISIWTQIHDLPLDWITRRIGMQLGSDIGCVEDVDIPFGGILGGKFLRIRVRINLNRPLVQFVIAKRKNAEPRFLEVKYERLPIFCFKCGKIGHDNRQCSTLTDSGGEKEATLLPFGVWLKAENGELLNPHLEHFKMKGRKISGIHPSSSQSPETELGMILSPANIPSKNPVTVLHLDSDLLVRRMMPRGGLGFDEVGRPNITLYPQNTSRMLCYPQVHVLKNPNIVGVDKMKYQSTYPEDSNNMKNTWQPQELDLEIPDIVGQDQLRNQFSYLEVSNKLKNPQQIKPFNCGNSLPKWGIDTFQHQSQKSSCGHLQPYKSMAMKIFVKFVSNLSEGGTPPRFLIIDDGWQDTVNEFQKDGEPFVEGSQFGGRLVSIKENNKFRKTANGTFIDAPSDLKEFVSDIRRTFGLKYIYVWHALMGYWGGVHPNAPGTEKYKSKLRYPVQSPGTLANARDISMDCMEKYGVGIIDPTKISQFYDDLHRYLVSQDVDGVKVDVQNILETVATGLGGRVSLTQQFQAALENSIAANFQDNSIICCMGQNTDSVYSAKRSAITRASDDYMPRNPTSQTLHIAAVAFNSIFLGEVMVPDWDMFYSRHYAAEYHAVARAVGGCGVYVSDKPGQHDFTVLKRLVLPDGSVLRAKYPGRPSRDCLFNDPVMDGKSLLKIWNLNKFTGVLGIFNCQGAGSWPCMDSTIQRDVSPELSGYVSPADIEYFEEVSGKSWTGDCAVFAFNTGSLSRLPHTESLNVSLKVLQCNVFTISPIKIYNQKVQFAPIGLVDMYNSGGAIEAIEFFSDSSNCGISIKGRGSGRFGAYSSAKPKFLSVNKKEEEFKFKSDDNFLTTMIPAGTSSWDIVIYF